MNFKVNESKTKLRGGYYTPLELAQFLTAWALETKPRSILEPSCGDGVFIDAVAKLQSSSTSITAFEIEPEEAVKARRKIPHLAKGTKASVHNGDFLEWLLLTLNGDQEFDAVVGNPPFIRYQYLDATLQSRAEKLFSLLHLKFTKHTNAWVPFVLGGICKLRPGGRLAMVIPAEILHVLHAQPLREYLARECSRILLIDPQELWFDALQGAVLLLAEKKANTDAPDASIGVLRVANNEFMSETAEECFHRSDFVPSSHLNTKWMVALLNRDERELLTKLSHHPRITRFGKVAKVDVGIVTGANKFFLVPDEVVESNGLRAWAHPMFGRSEHARGVIYDVDAHEENRKLGLPCNFLWFTEKDLDEYPQLVQEYMQEGITQALHTRYKCRVRDPWFLVPSVYSTPVAMLKRCHDFPRLILNKMEAYTTDTAYRIIPQSIGAEELVFGFVNSLTALSAELEGRHYGGGVLELVPSEIERLLIPRGPKPNGHLRALDRTMRAGESPEELFASQDPQVLGKVGVQAEEISALQNAWQKLRARRQRHEAECDSED